MRIWFRRILPWGLLAVGLPGGFFAARWTAVPAVFPVPEIAALAQRKNAGLAEQIDTLRLSLGVPGVWVGVWEGEALVFGRGFGTRELGGNFPPDERTVFAIGSLSKMAVTTAVLRLEARGNFSLRDAVADFVADVPRGGEITWEMLGRHTSGLAEYIAAREPKEMLAAEPERKWRAEELLGFAYGRGGKFAPGEKWAYANTNTVLLGMGMERAEGKELRAILAEEIFAPLGLARTDFGRENLLGEENAARGYNWGDAAGPSWWRGRGNVLHETTRASLSIWQAAGGITSCGQDVGKMTRAVARGNLVTAQQQAARLRWEPTDWAEEISSGFGVLNFAGWIGHSGVVPGYSAFAAHEPERDVTVVVLTNLYADRGNGVPAERIFELVREFRARGKSSAEGKKNDG